MEAGAERLNRNEEVRYGTLLFIDKKKSYKTLQILQNGRCGAPNGKMDRFTQKTDSDRIRSLSHTKTAGKGSFLLSRRFSLTASRFSVEHPHIPKKRLQVKCFRQSVADAMITTKRSRVLSYTVKHSAPHHS